MAAYYTGHREIRKPFWIDIEKDKLKVQCAIYERWQFRESGTCYCGKSAPVKYSKQNGISETTSRTIKATIETTLGLGGVAQLKSGIEGALGHEINWSQGETREFSSECTSPQCGRSELAIYELVRDYDLVIYRRGFHIFRSNVWDIRPPCTITEMTGRYAAVECEHVEWDESCHCPLPEREGDYDGRLSIDLGALDILAAYGIEGGRLKVRIMDKVVTFPLHDPARAAASLQRGVRITIESSFLHPALMFFGDIPDGASLDAAARIYRDAGTSAGELPEIFLQYDEPFIRGLGGEYSNS